MQDGTRFLGRIYISSGYTLIHLPAHTGLLSCSCSQDSELRTECASTSGMGSTLRQPGLHSRTHRSLALRPQASRLPSLNMEHRWPPLQPEFSSVPYVAVVRVNEACKVLLTMPGMWKNYCIIPRRITCILFPGKYPGKESSQRGPVPKQRGREPAKENPKHSSSYQGTFVAGLQALTQNVEGTLLCSQAAKRLLCQARNKNIGS